MKRTAAALLARGVDSETASRLADGGWTLARLQQRTPAQLTDLGISSYAATQLTTGKRPPIPLQTAMRVLFRNRFQCCVCRDPTKAIILHHITPWAQSRSHDEANLAVLCLEHHAQAHTVSSLAKNLDGPTLLSLKQQWEETCAEEDARSIIQASRLNYSAWLYFNHLRLFELASELGVSLAACRGFDRALAGGLIEADGSLRPRSASLSYMYDDVQGMDLYDYVRGVLEATLERATIINFSDLLDRGNAHTLIAPGDLIFVQGAHTFSRLNRTRRGRGEATLARRRANNVEIKFTFDRWEATSCSAWAMWLTGRQAVASLVQVKAVEREHGDAVVSGTVIAISNGHHNLQRRDYSPRFGRYVFDDDETDEEEGWGELLTEGQREVAWTAPATAESAVE